MERQYSRLADATRAALNSEKTAAGTEERREQSSERRSRSGPGLSRFQAMRQNGLSHKIRFGLQTPAFAIRLGRVAATIMALAVAFAVVPCARAATHSARKAHHQPALHTSHVKAATSRTKKSSSRVKHIARHRRGSSATVHRRRLRRPRARRRPPNTYTRLAHMQIDPSRVEHIQQAMIDAGAMQGTPTGHWDARTRDAMARYQAENGFGVTGLPDAKSLMKLGLGPHPLPRQLSKTAATPTAGVEKSSQTPAEAVPSGTLSEGPAAPSSDAKPPGRP